MMFSSVKIRLNVVTLTILTITSISVVFLVNHFQKQNALETAEEKSLIILQHYLAVHSYINNNLKPNIFALTDTIIDPDYFDPIWMSSTYAVRNIDKAYNHDIGSSYYYKEAAINARSPENEADDFERDFIRRLAKDKNFKKISGVRNFDDKPYFFTLVRGESMEKGCMRCHSTPDKAPGNLVKQYGATRSFNRSSGEVVSAVSIRVPLEQAYHDANIFSAKLSGVLLLLLLATSFLKNRLINHQILAPLYRLKSQAESIAGNPEHLGTAIPQIYTLEMNEIADSFNKMSSRLKLVVDSLDKTIEDRTAELQAKNTELERFTHTVSHDLKSPLITIQYFTGQIMKDLDSCRYDSAQDDLGKITAAASKMTDLLNDLLELSRIGRMKNYSEQIDMRRLVGDILEQLAGLLGQRQVEIVVQPDLPVVLGDPQRIAEVLQNLIENAVKYMGDQAAPRIEIGASQDGNKSVFFVSDNGKGIDPLYHEKIFGLFDKLDSNSEGTGVGLALVRRIIEVHGGRVWVESEGVGQGSRFCFTVPVKGEM